jgi:predicted transcriptional regulator
MLPDDMDAVFQSLAHRDRRKILDLVANSPGCCVEDLCPHFDTSRIAILKHLHVLERAQLLVSKRVGRKRTLFFNAVPIQLIYDRWATDYRAHWAGKLSDLKHRIEAKEKNAREKRKRHA